jgi:hypothetical protein
VIELYENVSITQKQYWYEINYIKGKQIDNGSEKITKRIYFESGQR